MSAAEAVCRLTELLEIPKRRPDAWEAAPVSSLETKLREILAVLQADDDDLRTRLLDVAE
jgi:hypothetical protein